VSRIWIRGGRVLDPAVELDARVDVLVEDGRIEAFGDDLAPTGSERVDADGC
jgi:dihydroorotase